LMHFVRPLGLAVAVTPRWSLLRECLVIVGFSLLIALAARIAVTLPFTPVPITGQTLAVLLAGAVLGSRRGFVSVLLYLGWGTSGLPVFAGGAAGAFWTTPSGGFLIGFPFAAFAVGYLTERGLDRGLRLAVALLAGNTIIYLFGLPPLAWFIANDWTGLASVIPGSSLLQKTLSAGLYPFILGDLGKLVVAALVLPSARRLAASYKG
jgi:biotin transport system substrate-specific component